MPTNFINRRSNLGKAIFFIARAAVVLVLALPLSVAAQQRYEPPAVLSASRILPAELLSGPNHHVQERVTNDGIVNIYKIDSKFGTFDALSTAMLRIRIQEINAIVTRVRDSAHGGSVGDQFKIKMITNREVKGGHKT